MRILFALLCFLLSVTPAHAGAFSVTLNATTAQNKTTTGIAWTDPTFAAVEDGNNASNALNPGEITDHINGRTSSISTAGQTWIITGVLCEFYGYADIADSTQVTEAYLTTGNGTIASSAESVGKPLADSPEWGGKGSTIGGDGVMWGLTSTQILAIFVTDKNPGCRFHLEEIGGNSVNVFVDAIRVTLFYDIKARTLANVGAGQ